MPEPSENPVTAQDWFGVGIRMFALWPLFRAVENLIFFVDVRLGLSTAREYGGDDDPIGYLFYTIGYGAFAACLLCVAPSLVAFSYPVSSKEPQDDPDSDTPE